MLNNYLSMTQGLLQNPGAPQSLYSTTNLTTWINTARGQIAGEGECIRVIGTLPTVVGQRAYNFSSIGVGTPASTGIQAAFNIRRITYTVASGQKWVQAREWEYFDYYYLNNPVPVNGYPQHWSQYAQGAASPGVGGDTGTGASGSFYIDPPPDLVYTLNCDCTCYPQTLAADGDVEALPFPWTNAVPFLAAYWALMSSQTSEREAQAARMYMEHYQNFMQVARRVSNPSVNRFMYEQADDPSQLSKLGLKPNNQQGGGQ